MTLQEALKSGRRYKRQPQVDWFLVKTHDYLFSIDEVLAEDWEIEEEKIEITKDQADEAFRYAVNSVTTMRTVTAKIIKNGFLEILGFKS